MKEGNNHEGKHRQKLHTQYIKVEKKEVVIGHSTAKLFLNLEQMHCSSRKFKAFLKFEIGAG